MQKLRERFYLWAFLDINRTGDYEQTFFNRFCDRNNMDNMNMIADLSLLLSVISGMLTFYFALKDSSFATPFFHAVILLTMVVFLYLTKTFTFQYGSNALCNNTVLLFNFFLYFFCTIYVFFDVPFSPVLFYIVLALSQVVFIFPPVYATLHSLLWIAIHLIISFFVQTPLQFNLDCLSCLIVFCISLMVGWYIGKTRATQAFATEQSEQMTKALKLTSVTDQLTSLLNHRSFQNQYYQLFEASQTTSRRIGIIMIDIDKFKLYNDYYGHTEGDNCLATIGRTISTFAGDQVSAFRFGGEEFVLLLWGNATKQTIALAEQIRKTIYNMQIPHEYSPIGTCVTVSVGVYVATPKRDDKPMDFFDRADQAMYRSKKARGNVVSAYYIEADDE
ncbi:MAG: GGDEF domain-containing protein [Clostridiales bacterium]|nr:GGDEF domain-containing protein [Clostridiales bacterium]